MNIECERWHAVLDSSHCGERLHCKGCPQCPEKTEEEWSALRKRSGFGAVEGIPERLSHLSPRKGADKWKYLGNVK